MTQPNKKIAYKLENGTGIERLFRPYEVEVLEYLWDRTLEDPNFRAGSGQVFKYLIEKHGERYISRASVIFFLNKMVDWPLALETEYHEDQAKTHKVYQSLMGFDDATGKGGHHRLYFIRFDKKTFGYRMLLTLLWQIREEWQIPVPGDYMHEGYEW